jgi:hypothetical protein
MRMTLKKFYLGLSPRSPRRELVEQLAKATKKSEMTVRGWLTERSAPDKLTQKVIEDTVGIPASELFPTKNEEQ